MRIRLPRPFAAALVLMLAVSCVSPTWMCGCPPSRDEAVLYGRVTDAAGSPVAKATVRAEEGPPGCGEGTGGMAWASTDANGRYRTIIYRTSSLMECMRAFAVPPAGSTLRGSDTVPIQVRFARRPVDSARVDLVLRGP